MSTKVSLKWTDQEDEIIKKYYYEYGYTKVMEFLPHRTRSSIQQRASKKLKIKQKALSYNEDYFDVIDSEEKAYWLGFIYADGYVTTGNRFGITLSINDIYHLMKFKNAINFTGDIKTRKRTSRFDDYSSVYEECSIFINNKKMYESLVKCGVKMNKSYDIEFPSIDILEEKYINHFIRGYFDGDGTFSMSKFQSSGYECTTKEISAICNVESFIDSMNKKLLEYGIEMKKSKNRNHYVSRVHNSKNIIRLIDFLYKDATIYLERKKDKADSLYDYASKCRSKTL